MGQFTELKAPDGQVIPAYLAEPKGPAKGGIVVIQEIFGINSHIRAVTDGYAAEGYLAIAPAIFHRIKPNVELGYEQDDMTQGMTLKNAVENLPAPGVMQDIQVAIKQVARAGKVGIVGFCYGGGVCNNAAVANPQLAAAVPFYGRQPQADQVSRIQAPLLLHYAEKDDGVNKGWPDYEAALKANGKTYEAHVYPGTQHGFHNDSTPRYDEAAAELAWQRTIDWFKEYLA